MANVLLDVVDTFDSLNAQYTPLLAACRGETQRLALETQYAAAQANAETVTGEMLGDDDEEIAGLGKQLKACNLELKQAVKVMGTMSKVLDNLTDAVEIGSKLIAAM